MSEKEVIAAADVGVLDVGGVVGAAGTAAAGKGRGLLVEEAMAAAGLRAMEEGITDPEEIRARKLAAREDVKTRLRAAEEAAASQPAEGG